MGTMLLPEHLGGRDSLFSFSRSTRGLPGPIPAVSGGARLSGTADPCGAPGFRPGNLEPPPASHCGEDGSGEQRLRQQQGPPRKASLYFSSLKNFICVYKKKPKPNSNPKLQNAAVEVGGRPPPACRPQEAVRTSEGAGAGRAVAGGGRRGSGGGRRCPSPSVGS